MSNFACPVCTMPIGADGECERHTKDEMIEWGYKFRMDRDAINAKLDEEMKISAGLRERIESLEAGGLNQKPFMYAMADRCGQVVMDEICCSESPDELSEIAEAHDANVLPVYTGPQVLKMAEERDAAIVERDRLREELAFLKSPLSEGGHYWEREANKARRERDIPK